MLQVNIGPASTTVPVEESEGVSIAEASRLTGLGIYTLRYYEREGLVITPIRRTVGNQRQYHKLDLEWILMCTKLRATGMPIKAIRQYAQLVSAGHGNERERLVLMETHRAKVLSKLEEIQDNVKLIEHKIDVYRSRLEAGDIDQVIAFDHPAGGS
jgi:DNA-binding transcriptional MerR regulator